MEGRRGYLATRLTVLLAGVAGVLSVVTGILGFAIRTEFLLTGVVPPTVQQFAGFTGTLTGFALLASVVGLRRGLRAAWYAAMVLLSLSAVQGVVQSSPYSVPLILVSLSTLPGLWVNRGRFDRELSLSLGQLAAAVALSGTLAYGTLGTFALRDHFANVETPADALYYTVVTASTVGYGDITPDTGDTVATLFAISVVVLGTASFALALGALLGPAIEARFARALGRMTEQQLELLEDHALVLGYGDLTEPILDELVDASIEFVVITPDGDRATALSQRGINVVTADPSDEEPLERAGLDRARAVVVATNDDAEDALAVLTARQLRPDVRIVAAATDLENVDKLKRAGADAVISPASIGGHMLVQSALEATDIEREADRILRD